MINLNEIAKKTCESAKKNGFDPNPPFPEVIAFCHSELSEALEEYRYGRPIKYCGQYMGYEDGCCQLSDDCSLCQYHQPEGIGIELADCILRILCYCGANDIDIEEMIEAKHLHNMSRKYVKGVKKI
jgi:NTP pyrophosphatase (non-canonical NTP hydrolase)